ELERIAEDNDRAQSNAKNSQHRVPSHREASRFGWTTGGKDNSAISERQTNLAVVRSKSLLGQQLRNQFFEVFARIYGSHDAFFVDQEHRRNRIDSVLLCQGVPAGSFLIEQLRPGHVRVFREEVLQRCALVIAGYAQDFETLVMEISVRLL